jgi:hypothetical protein
MQLIPNQTDATAIFKHSKPLVGNGRHVLTLSGKTTDYYRSIDKAL